MSDEILTIAIKLVLVLALVLANGFFVAAEFSLVTVRRTRIEEMIVAGRTGATSVRRALDDPDRYIAATQLGITMASIGLGWIGEPAFATLVEPSFAWLGVFAVATAHSISVAIAFACITALHIVLGELAPKTVALQHPESTSLWVARPTELFMKSLWPFIAALNGTGGAVVRLFGMKPRTEHAHVHSPLELKMLVSESQAAGLLDPHEREMLHRVFGLGDLTAAQVMTPRTELEAIPSRATHELVLAMFRRSPFDWLAVYGADADEVVGVIRLKEVLTALVSPEHPTVEQLVREIPAVPETATADHVVLAMQRRGVEHALVIDEYGGTAGIVALDNLTRRILGTVPVDWRPDAPTDSTFILDGLTPLPDVNDRFGLHIDPHGSNTLGGYVLSRLGRAPQLGDEIEVEQFALRVASLDGLRIATVQIRRPASKPVS
jgi:putative hemolysin